VNEDGNHLKINGMMAAALAASLLLGACGDDDDEAAATDTSPTDGGAQAFCEMTASFDEQDGPPTEEQLAELESISPEVIAEDVGLIAARVGEVGEAAFGEPEVGRSISAIETWEAENCEAAEAAEAVEPDPDATELSVTAGDYFFEIDGEVPAGKVAFVMENIGEEPHHMDIVRLRDGTTAADLEAAAETGLEAVDALIIGEVGSTAEAAPGASAVVNVDLETGVYGVGCFVRSPDGSLHFEQGMRTVFTVS
jgi:hypothetical protein